MTQTQGFDFNTYDLLTPVQRDSHLITALAHAISYHFWQVAEQQCADPGDDYEGVWSPDGFKPHDTGLMLNVRVNMDIDFEEVALAAIQKVEDYFNITLLQEKDGTP